MVGELPALPKVRWWGSVVFLSWMLCLVYMAFRIRKTVNIFYITETVKPDRNQGSTKETTGLTETCPCTLDVSRHSFLSLERLSRHL